MLPNPQETAYLVSFTEEIFKNFIFCAVILKRLAMVPAKNKFDTDLLMVSHVKVVELKLKVLIFLLWNQIVSANRFMGKHQL